MALTIILEWANQTAQQLSPNRPAVFFPEDLRTKIWNNFLCRLSLDSWMIIGKNQTSNGNQVLGVMMQVIEDTIYSQFPLSPVRESIVTSQIIPPFRSNNTGYSNAIVPAPKSEQTSTYEKLFESNPYPRLPSTAEFPLQRSADRGTSEFPYRRSGEGLLPQKTIDYLSQHSRGGAAPMSTISEVDHEISEDELKLIQNSSRNVYLPRNNAQGMPVKLRRLKNSKKKGKDGKEDSNKSRSRKRRSRSKPKIEDEEDRDRDDDEEEDEDEEDEDDRPRKVD